MGRWNPFNINNYTKPVKKTADDVLGIDDSGGLGGAAKKVARGVVSGVEVFADDFLGIDDSGGIIGSVKDIGSKFEDVVRDAVEEIDELVQNPYVRLAVRFIPGYGQIAGAVLDTYAKLDSGEELTAADAVNLGTAFAAQDVSKWNLSEGEVKAIKAAGKIATGSDPIETLVTTFGPDIVDQMGLEEKVSTAVAERFGQDTYDTIKDNIDYARAGYEIAVEGKDPLQTIAKYADTPAIEEFGKRALTTTFGEDAYNLFRENIDVARAGVDVLQGKDVSMVVADRFGDDIVTALGAEDPTLRAAGLGTLRTAALLDQGVPDYIAVGSGAKTFYEKGGAEGVQDYLASLDTSGLGTSLGVDLQPLTGALARGEDIVRETFTPEQREQARLLARDVKTLTTAASRGAASFEDTLRSVLPENVELASVTGGDIDAYRQELAKNLEGFDYSLLMPEGGYRATGGQGQYVATGGPSQYGKARTLFGVGESPIDQQMGSAMPDLAQLPEMAQLPTIGTEEEEQMPFQLGQVQTAREGGRFEKPRVQSGMRIPDDGLIQKNMDIIRRMPDVFYMNPGVAQTAAELDQIYAYNDRIAEIAMGSREAMQVGGVAGDQQVVEENQVVSSQPAGFIERAPEQVPEGATVADDVPLDVEDGTFVINAPAVEFAGSDDIKKMIMEAIDEAKGQGLDISFDGGKIPEEEAVSLLVSRGEVIVPPILAKIIGYDRLEKINNRGKKEVEDRVEENGQSPEAEAIDEQPANPAEGMAMAEGGESFIRRAYKTIPTNVRLLLEYMAGLESPITEKDFTEAELKRMAEVIEKQRGENVDREALLREMVESGKPYKQLETPEEFKNLTEFFFVNKGDANPVYVDFKGDFVDQNFVDEVEKNAEFRNALMERAKKALSSYENTRDTVTVGGKYYYRDDVERPSGYRGFVNKLQDPTYQVQTTVGEFKAKDSEDRAGYVVTDNYDFNSGEIGFESNKEITLEDIWDEREKPQTMAELLARYLRPEGGRPVEINLKRGQQADSPTMADGGVAVQGRGSSEPQPPVLAKSGGFIAMRDGGEVNPDQSIIDYHYNTIQKNKVGRDKEGRPITVYSTSIYIPAGKNKGKFALVPGYVDGSTDYSEDQLYEIWKEEIESGKWPIDSSGEESGKRAQRIHQVMDRDADTMPELKKEGGLTSFRGEGTSGDNQSYANIEAEYSGDGFIVKPRANYSEQNTTRNFPDGVVVNQKGKNIGFALNGEMFLSDDTSLRAGIERQANQSKTKVNLPENYGGQTLEFGGGQKMKRYNMGATFGDFSADVSKQQGAGQPLSGRVEYKFSPQGEVFIEGTEGGRSGRVGLQYRF